MDRVRRLMPDGVPRYVRCYDNGGSGDRYTVVYTGNYRGRGGMCRYVGMSALPFHPQGVGMHGESREPIDGRWAPAVGGRPAILAIPSMPEGSTSTNASMVRASDRSAR